MRADGVYLFVTNADKIVTDYLMGAVLAGDGVNTWSGLLSDWTSATPSCEDWTTESDEVFGRVGWDSTTDAGWLQGGVLPCSAEIPLVCAEQ